VTLTALASPSPTVVSTSVGTGAVQRSTVNSISVTFNEPIILDSGAFTLYQEALSTANGITTVNTGAAALNVSQYVTATLSNNNETVTFTVIPGSVLDRSGSFNAGFFTNGIYQLTLNGTAITDSTGTQQFNGGASTPVSFANSVAGDNGGSDYLAILYGDLYGTGSLNVSDARTYTLANNNGTTDNGYLDYYGTGSLSVSDARLFSKDNGIVYSY
jgi:hypothetical protein